MRLTPATSTPGSSGLRAMTGDALSPPDHAQDPTSPPWLPVAGGLCAAGGRERSASRGQQRAQLHHSASIAGLAPWLCRCPARCRAAHAATTGTAPVLPLRDPPGRSRRTSKCILTLPQEQPLGSPRLSAAPSLQLVRSAGFLLPRYGFGFNNS